MRRWWWLAVLLALAACGERGITISNVCTRQTPTTVNNTNDCPDDSKNTTPAPVVVPPVVVTP